ncbi:hypothetical protein D3C85_1673650 [compost metagenome]
MIHGIELQPAMPMAELIGALPNGGEGTDAIDTILGYLYWLENVRRPLSSHNFRPTLPGPTASGAPTVEARAHSNGPFD